MTETMKLSELLTDESKACRGAAARNSAGVEVHPLSGDAVAFCPLGAIWRCYPAEERRDVEMKLIDRIFGAAIRAKKGKRKLGMCLSVWWDSPARKFPEVRKVILECGL